VGDNTPLDLKNADDLKAVLVDLKEVSKKNRDDVTGLREYIDQKLKDASDEKKSFGATFADTQEKLKEIATKAAEGLGKIANAEKEIEKHHDAIEKLHSQMQARGGRIANDEEAKAQRKLLESTAQFMQVKAAEKCGPGDKVPRFDPDKITADQVKEYEEGKRALAKMRNDPTYDRRGGKS
jgi:DNA repair exonuclease SbcCD ATPase subunit